MSAADDSWAEATRLFASATPVTPRTTVNKTYNVYCKANNLVSGIKELVESVSTMNDAMTSSQASIDNMVDALDDIAKIQMHIHDCHWHATTHYAEEGIEGVPIGDVFRPSHPDEIDILMQESQTGMDKDENGLVYCHDFIISNNDPKKPGVLKDVELHFKYDGISLPTRSMSWSSYLSTLPWCT